MNIQHYESPLGGLLLAADEIGLTGVWFSGQKHFARGLPEDAQPRETPALAQTKRWLDRYFSGREPGETPALHPAGSAFQRAVWALLLQIPYGTVTTYGALAQSLAASGRTSARAVGGAVGRNPISVLIPCHRVLGADGSLTGYAGGVERKMRLLELEGVDTARLRLPRRGTAI